MSRIGYDDDFFGWTNEQSALLRAGRLGEADIANTAEEIESIGRSEKRERVNRLAAPLTHLLKWRHQLNHRTNSWRSNIRVQRIRFGRRLGDNPSLRPLLPQAVADAYADALIVAADETGLAEQTFPQTSPFDIAAIFDSDFWPD